MSDVDGKIVWFSWNYCEARQNVEHVKVSVVTRNNRLLSFPGSRSACVLCVVLFSLCQTGLVLYQITPSGLLPSLFFLSLPLSFSITLSLLFPPLMSVSSQTCCCKRSSKTSSTLVWFLWPWRSGWTRTRSPSVWFLWTCWGTSPSTASSTSSSVPTQCTSSRECPRKDCYVAMPLLLGGKKKY